MLFLYSVLALKIVLICCLILDIVKNLRSARMLCHVCTEFIYEGVSIIIFEFGISKPSAMSFNPCNAPEVTQMFASSHSIPNF